MSLLCVGAPVVDVGVGEARGPHHDSAEACRVVVLVDEFGELVRRDVVRLAARAAVGCEGGSWHADAARAMSAGGLEFWI